MKYLKIIGLAVVAAMATMAFVGAGSASASVKLCKANEATCSAANTYAVPQGIKAVLEGTAVLKAGPIEDECTESTMGGKATAYDATEVLGLLESVTFPAASCTCEEQKLLNLPYKVSVLEPNAAGEAVWHFTSGGTGNPSGLVKCGSLSCVYEKANVLVTSLNKTGLPLVDVNVELTVNGNKDSGFTCLFGGNAHWEASYIITEPDPVWITK